MSGDPIGEDYYQECKCQSDYRVGFGVNNGDQARQPECCGQGPEEMAHVSELEAGTVEVGQEQEEGEGDCPNGGEQVGESGDRKQDSGSPAALAGSQDSSEIAEKENRKAEADGERELAGHCGLDVAAVDREVKVAAENEGHCGQRHENWHGPTKAGHRSSAPSGDRDQREAEDRHQLECDLVGNDVAQRNDGEHR